MNILEKILIIIIVCLAAMLMLGGKARAANYGPYEVNVVSVYDGDTFTADVQIWPGITVRTPIRVVGIDAPELKGVPDCEKTMAASSRDYARSLLMSAKVTINEVVTDAYPGRYDAEVYINGQPFATAMIQAGKARVSFGTRTGAPWCLGG